ncbi:MAG TPA: hypothetical protein VEG44_06405 [Candidatus Acidoferrales bacterium]|nr:hypothetical protein [Candidatus Acidoferrales bacterium]
MVKKEFVNIIKGKEKRKKLVKVVKRNVVPVGFGVLVLVVGLLALLERRT